MQGGARIDGVDGDDGRREWKRRAAVDEALGMGLISDVEGRSSLGGDRLHSAEEDVGRCEKSEARLTVLMGVPAEEVRAPAAGVGDVAEAARVVGLILDGLEAGLRERGCRWRRAGGWRFVEPRAPRGDQ